MYKVILTACLWIISFAALALPNPAATNCINQGFKYLMIKNTGICLFPDDSYCEEWAYFRKTCKPGQHKAIVKKQRPFANKNSA